MGETRWLAHNRGCASRHRLLYSSHMPPLIDKPRPAGVFLTDACANPACGHSVSDHVTKTEAERENPLACYLCDCLCFKEPKPE